jgi:hypothetical protein
MTDTRHHSKTVYNEGIKWARLELPQYTQSVHRREID